MRLIQSFVFVPVLMLATACLPVTGITVTDESKKPGVVNGTLTARVDGNTFQATNSATADVGVYSWGTLIHITGSQLVSGVRREIGVQFIVSTLQAGTYKLEDGGSGEGYIFDYQSALSVKTWSSEGTPRGMGSVTVTSYASGRIKGFFNFVAMPRQGGTATGVRSVTTGTFDIAIGQP